MAVYGETRQWAPIPLPDPWQSGYTAGKCGSLGRCPYAAGTPERTAYMNGYYEGEKLRRFGR